MKELREVLFMLSVILFGCALVFQMGNTAMTIGGISLLLYTVNIFASVNGKDE